MSRVPCQKEVLTQQRLEHVLSRIDGRWGNGQKEVLTQQRLKLTTVATPAHKVRSERSSNTTKIETHNTAKDPIPVRVRKKF